MADEQEPRPFDDHGYAIFWHKTRRPLKAAKVDGKDVNWTIVICSSAAPSVTLQAGGSSDDNVVFAKWEQGMGQRFYPVPARYQGDSSIFVQLTLSEGDGQTEAGIGYQGHCVKAIHMDNGNENHQVDKDDSDDGCACR